LVNQILILHIAIVDLAYDAGMTDCLPAGGLSDLWLSIAFRVLASQDETRVYALAINKVSMLTLILILILSIP
jgi:hypothetical protein